MQANTKYMNKHSAELTHCPNVLDVSGNERKCHCGMLPRDCKGRCRGETWLTKQRQVAAVAGHVTVTSISHRSRGPPPSGCPAPRRPTQSPSRRCRSPVAGRSTTAVASRRLVAPSDCHRHALPARTADTATISPSNSQSQQVRVVYVSCRNRICVTADTP